MIDGFLVAVTVFSLGLAAVMAVITWRAIRLGRQQTFARADLRSRLAERPQQPTNTMEPQTWPPTRRGVGNPPVGIPRGSSAVSS